MLIEGKAYTRIGGWLARKGENEIDIVAENELNAEAVFIDVKRKSQNFDSEALNNKVATFSRATGRLCLRKNQRTADISQPSKYASPHRHDVC